MKHEAVSSDDDDKDKPAEWTEQEETFDWTAHVGPAHIFYSHIQSTDPERMVQCMRESLGTHRGYVPAPKGKTDVDGVFFWLDYFVLRQCLRDFDLQGTRDVIKKLGCTFIELDHAPSAYLTRSFCILRSRSLCHDRGGGADMHIRRLPTGEADG